MPSKSVKERSKDGDETESLGQSRGELQRKDSPLEKFCKGLKWPGFSNFAVFGHWLEAAPEEHGLSSNTAADPAGTVAGTLSGNCLPHS